MEEISWGQRLIGLRTPQFMKEVNTLDEINIHNILPISHREFVFSGFFLLVGLFFLLRDIIEKKTKNWDVTKRIIPFLPPSDFFYFGLLIFAMLLVHEYFVIWEVFEQIFAVIGITYAIHVYRRCKTMNQAGHSEFRKG